jgi:predicted dehydrogenase
MTDDRKTGATGVAMPGQDQHEKRVPRLAVVGCGAIAEQYYLPALTRRPDVLANLILVDRDAARSEHLATQFGV